MSELQHVTKLQNRGNKLLAQIATLQRQIQDAKKEEAPPRRDDILNALDDFREFFQDYNAYFRRPEVKAQIGDQTTESHVLATALEKTVQNLATLSRAIDQRYNPMYREELIKADVQAHKLYRRFKGYDEGRLPMTYFQRIYNLTRFAYRSLPLLAIPLDRFGENDPAAIAHELGHYIFWNSGDLGEYHTRVVTLRRAIARAVIESDNPNLNLDNPPPADAESKKIGDWLNALDLEDPQDIGGLPALSENVRIWLRWAEETFADVFGTLMIGPEFAKSAQDLQVREGLGDRQQLIQDDGEHPMPYLRPLIAIKTLSIVADKNAALEPDLKAVATQLVQRWKTFGDAGAALKVDANRHSHAVVVAPGELQKPIQAIISAILNAGLFPGSLLEKTVYWGQAGTDAEKTELANMAADLATNLLPDLPPESKSPDTTKRAPKALAGPALSPSFTRLLDFVQDRRDKRRLLKTLESEEWQDLLEIDLSLEVGHSSNPGTRATHSHTFSHIHESGVIKQA